MTSVVDTPNGTPRQRGSAVHRWIDLLRRDPATVVPRVVGGLIAVQLLLRAVVAAQGWFHLDDIVFIQRASTEPFDLDYLLHDHAGHVMPGGYTIVSVLTALVPLQWSTVVAIELIGQLAVDIVLYRLLVSLFGLRPAIVVPFAVFVTAGLTLPASVWWAAGINQLPLQLALLLALGAHVRYLRSGERRYAVHAALWVAGGLLFSEKTLLAVPLLLAVTLGWFGTGSLPARVRHEWSARRLAWILYGSLAVAYVVYYLAAVPSPFRTTPVNGNTAEILGNALFGSILPGLLGGPWTWEYVPRTLPTAGAPAGLLVASAVVVALVVTASIVRHRGAARAWALLGGVIVFDVMLVGASRAQSFDAEVLAREYRYVTEVALVAALALALAYLPVRDAPVVLHPRSGRLQPAGDLVRRVVRPEFGAAAVALLVIGSVVSGISYARGWSDNEARTFVANARADLDEAPGTVLVDARVPDGVMWAALGDYTRASAVLAGLGDSARFVQDGTSVPELRMLDEQGHVRNAWVPPVSQIPPGPAENCGWPVLGAAPVTLPLTQPVGDARWMIRIAYLSQRDTSAWVSAGRDRVPVLLPAGLADVFVQVTGTVDGATIELRDPGAALCVGQVEVGTAFPLPEGF